MDAPVYEWLQENLEEDDFKGKQVLEVGSQNVNGSARDIITHYRPGSYLGVDFQAGPGVDRVLNVRDLVAAIGESSFDTVISTEMLEHVEDWRTAVNQMKLALKPGGSLIISTRRPGFERHGYPHDYWRFTVQNLRAAFVDFWIVKVQNVSGQGVVLHARKPYAWEAPASLDHINPASAPENPYRGFRRLVWLKVAYGFRDPAVPKPRESLPYGWTNLYRE